MRLSVLDQSPIHDGGTQGDGLRATLALAVEAEALGYHRYWVAEHHDLAGFAGSCPEIMIAEIAGRTTRIRVGSGGVMLAHYAPLKVAETFRMLATLHPGRIDLGIGRAPGGDGRAMRALSFPHHPPDADTYGRLALDLGHFLHDAVPETHMFHGMTAVPAPPEIPQYWQLGSGGGSAEFAGSLGMAYALALFIGNDPAPPEIFELYRRTFRPSAALAAPATALAVSVICAANDAAAARIAASQTWWRYELYRYGRSAAFVTPDEALALRDALPPAERAYHDSLAARIVLGGSASCARQLRELAARYAVDELILVTVCHHYADRLDSYRRLAQAFELTSAPETAP
ncbi:MAG: MsnO8 family LLM class oxidoreductase [Gammaproteobacteria bacterium]|nr:MsnO8 family LLM class oxidoreductase [Gammaproteobacteria bacterium]